MLQGWLRALRERLAAWDAELARRTLTRFELEHGLDLRGGRVVLGDLDAVRRALVPEARALVEHHWATWCTPCIDELGRVEALARQLRGRADVVGVCWDRFQAHDEAAEVTRARVEALCADRGVSWPSLVYTGAPEALFDALRLPAHTVPLTRVLDADGGILRVIEGPLRDDDLAALAALLEG